MGAPRLPCFLRNIQHRPLRLSMHIAFHSSSSSIALNGRLVADGSTYNLAVDIGVPRASFNVRRHLLPLPFLASSATTTTTYFLKGQWPFFRDLTSWAILIIRQCQLGPWYCIPLSRVEGRSSWSGIILRWKPMITITSKGPFCRHCGVNKGLINLSDGNRSRTGRVLLPNILSDHANTSSLGRPSPQATRFRDSALVMYHSTQRPFQILCSSRTDCQTCSRYSPCCSGQMSFATNSGVA